YLWLCCFVLFPLHSHPTEDMQLEEKGQAQVTVRFPEIHPLEEIVYVGLVRDGKTRVTQIFYPGAARDYSKQLKILNFMCGKSFTLAFAHPSFGPNPLQCILYHHNGRRFDVRITREARGWH